MTDNIIWHHAISCRARCEAQYGQKFSVIWLTGLFESGKSNLAHSRAWWIDDLGSFLSRFVHALFADGIPVSWDQHRLNEEGGKHYAITASSTFMRILD